MSARPILLVEDNPDDELLTLRAFHKSNVAMQIVVARDGVEAERLLESISPLLVLLDLKLPKIDGLAVLRRIRGDPRLAKLPVVVLTASREARDLEESYAAGATSFIRKPLDFERFVQVVQAICTYWATMNEPPP
jgi:two-component system response regulator